MDFIQTIIISIVEGLTEFLPVSSTGHMIIAENLLGVDIQDKFVNAFTVIIQFGAILSVICLYWKRFFYPDAVKTGEKTYWKAMFDFYARLVVGTLPAVVLGLAFNDFIESNLGNVQLVGWMLVIGGVFMLFCDKIFNKGSEQTKLTYKRALTIGFIQCIAMIPGVSRSMSTIVGGMSQRLTRKAAAEFSFFLAVPTMFGATCLEVYKLISHGGGSLLTQGNNLFTLILGSVVAFIVAILAIKFFINYVTKYGFAAFGWYRIVVGLIIIICGLCGVDMQMVDLNKNMDFRKGEIIAIDKPYRMSSFGALAHVRYLLSKKLGFKVKIGHAGTLDPLATGVLVLCTGKCTKQIEQLQTHTKEYTATLQLGATTASYDKEHSVNHTFPTEHITRELVEEVLKQFVGEIQQVPPTYSAVKVNGDRSYALRRAGEEVQLKPKTVRVDEIELTDYNDEEKTASIRVVCGKGTYIRSLARDIGRALDSGAYLTALRRTKAGSFSVENCIDFDHFQEWLDAQEIEDSLANN